MRSGEEIQRALKKFSKKWSTFKGSEKAEAQTFLNQLFEAYGSDRAEIGAKFEDFKTSAGFMDLHWPAVCIVEMKAPHVPVKAARDQVKRYWEESADEDEDIPAARWVVLCNFKEFEIWEPGRFPKSPRVTFTLETLPDRYETLMFLTGPEQLPSFLEHHKELTTRAADTIAEVYQSLVDRSAAPPDEIIRFTMQSIWTMFAEDLGLLEGSPFQKTVEQLRKNPEDSAAKLGFLFSVLNQKGDHNRKGILAGTRYVNGQLFADPAALDLNSTELGALAQAAEYDWSKVEPTIFGSLMEKIIAGKLGAHYTHEADIMKIVGPTIVRPWQERIDSATTPNEARQVLEEICSFTVLDPAVGCGNFLYVAYRELRHLEYLAKQRISELSASTGLPLPPDPWPYVPLTNFYGMDIQPAAVLIARVTLWMGHRQMIDRYGEAETPLPLVSLAGISTGDALRVPWPEVDTIIGNPPFLGSQLIRREISDTYADWLSETFQVGVKELCVYWFRLAQERLKPGQRAGLVGTNSVSQNKARSASLDYITETGGTITDAVSSQKWPGEAKVHVSIVNWVKGEAEGPFTLDGREVEAIDSSLRSGSAWKAKPLGQNNNKCFQGVIPVGEGFILSPDEAQGLLQRTDANYREVVKPYLIGEDLTEDVCQQPRRWIIDFGFRELQEANKYPAAMKIVRDRVKPERDDNEADDFRTLWWRFGRPRPTMYKALSGLGRYIAIGAQGKRLVACWQDMQTTPSNLTFVASFDDDYAMGVIHSAAHTAWAWHQSSTLKSDLRYTPTSVFRTFPWPDHASATQRTAVSDAARMLIEYRTQLCKSEGVGLTDLYNSLDEGAYSKLQALHRSLDEAVAEWLWVA
ncbi:hypothetical protein GS539_20165 [Rhodococcus hoagii]|nr:hypothetical protein [Prescottella equi]